MPTPREIIEEKKRKAQAPAPVSNPAPVVNNPNSQNVISIPPIPVRNVVPNPTTVVNNTVPTSIVNNPNSQNVINISPIPVNPAPVVNNTNPLPSQMPNAIEYLDSFERSLDGFNDFFNAYRLLYNSQIYNAVDDLGMLDNDLGYKARLKVFLKREALGPINNIDYNKKVEVSAVLSTLYKPKDATVTLDSLIQKLKNPADQAKTLSELNKFIANESTDNILYNDPIKPDTTVDGLVTYLNSKIDELNKTIMDKKLGVDALTKIVPDAEHKVYLAEVIRSYILISVLEGKKKFN